MSLACDDIQHSPSTYTLVCSNLCEHVNYVTSPDKVVLVYLETNLLLLFTLSLLPNQACLQIPGTLALVAPL